MKLKSFSGATRILTLMFLLAGLGSLFAGCAGESPIPSPTSSTEPTQPAPTRITSNTVTLRTPTSTNTPIGYVAPTQFTPVQSRSVTQIAYPPMQTIPAANQEQPTTTPTFELNPTLLQQQYYPECRFIGDMIHCKDNELEITFSYPARWGPIDGIKSEGDCGGVAISYNFIAQAGGLSLDFCKPIEGGLTSFRGFSENLKPGVNVTEICQKVFYRAQDCKLATAQVMMGSLYPDSGSICDPYADTIFNPLEFVAINLPEGKSVNGFVFLFPFLSTKATDQLFAPLVNPNNCAKLESKELFDQQVELLAQQVRTGQVDEETAYTLSLIMDFARSIEVIEP